MMTSTTAAPRGAESLAPAGLSPTDAARAPSPLRRGTVFVARKLGLFALTLWAAVTVNFLLPRLMPGTPADAALAKLAQNGPVTEATKAAIEAQLGVPTGNILDQYVAYLHQVVTLDFGISYTFYPQSVGELVSAALPYTLVLVGLVTV